MSLKYSFHYKWLCNTMLMTANIKRSFTSTFTKFHNYRFTNDRFVYIMRTIRFTNIQRFGMMTNTIYNMSILIAYITRTHRFTVIQQFDVLTDNTHVTDITCTNNSQTNRFTDSYGLTSLLLLLSLKAFCLLTLLEHAALTGLH